MYKILAGILTILAITHCAEIQIVQNSVKFVETDFDGNYSKYYQQDGFLQFKATVQAGEVVADDASLFLFFKTQTQYNADNLEDITEVYRATAGDYKIKLPDNSEQVGTNLLASGSAGIERVEFDLVAGKQLQLGDEITVLIPINNPGYHYEGSLGADFFQVWLHNANTIADTNDMTDLQVNFNQLTTGATAEDTTATFGIYIDVTDKAQGFQERNEFGDAELVFNIDKKIKHDTSYLEVKLSLDNPSNIPATPASTTNVELTCATGTPDLTTMEYIQSTNTLLIKDVFKNEANPITPGQCTLIIKGVKVQSYTDYSPKPVVSVGHTYGASSKAITVKHVSNTSGFQFHSGYVVRKYKNSSGTFLEFYFKSRESYNYDETTVFELVFPASLDAIDFAPITSTIAGLNTQAATTPSTTNDGTRTISVTDIFPSATNDSKGFSFIIQIDELDTVITSQLVDEITIEINSSGNAINTNKFYHVQNSENAITEFTIYSNELEVNEVGLRYEFELTVTNTVATDASTDFDLEIEFPIGFDLQNSLTNPNPVFKLEDVTTSTPVNIDLSSATTRCFKNFIVICQIKNVGQTLTTDPDNRKLKVTFENLIQNPRIPKRYQGFGIKIFNEGGVIIASESDAIREQLFPDADFTVLTEPYKIQPIVEYKGNTQYCKSTGGTVRIAIPLGEFTHYRGYELEVVLPARLDMTGGTGCKIGKPDSSDVLQEILEIGSCTVTEGDQKAVITLDQPVSGFVIFELDNIEQTHWKHKMTAGEEGTGSLQTRTNDSIVLYNNANLDKQSFPPCVHQLLTGTSNLISTNNVVFSDTARTLSFTFTFPFLPTGPTAFHVSIELPSYIELALATIATDVTETGAGSYTLSSIAHISTNGANTLQFQIDDAVSSNLSVTIEVANAEIKISDKTPEEVDEIIKQIEDTDEGNLVYTIIVHEESTRLNEEIVAKYTHKEALECHVTCKACAGPNICDADPTNSCDSYFPLLINLNDSAERKYERCYQTCPPGTTESTGTPNTCEACNSNCHQCKSDDKDFCLSCSGQEYNVLPATEIPDELGVCQARTGGEASMIAQQCSKDLQEKLGSNAATNFIESARVGKQGENIETALDTIVEINFNKLMVSNCFTIKVRVQNIDVPQEDIVFESDMNRLKYKIHSKDIKDRYACPTIAGEGTANETSECVNYINLYYDDPLTEQQVSAIQHTHMFTLKLGWKLVASGETGTDQGQINIVNTETIGDELSCCENPWQVNTSIGLCDGDDCESNKPQSFKRGEKIKLQMKISDADYQGYYLDVDSVSVNGQTEYVTYDKNTDQQNQTAGEATFEFTVSQAYIGPVVVGAQAVLLSEQPTRLRNLKAGDPLTKDDDYRILQRTWITLVDEGQQQNPTDNQTPSNNNKTKKDYNENNEGLLWGIVGTVIAVVFIVGVITAGYCIRKKMQNDAQQKYKEGQNPQDKSTISNPEISNTQNDDNIVITHQDVSGASQIDLSTNNGNISIVN